MKIKKVRAAPVKESSSAYFERLRPKFLDWQPPTEEEHAHAASAQLIARKAQEERLIELAQSRQKEKKTVRTRVGDKVAIKK